MSTGRYISSDPIGLEGGQNGYIYGLANPLLRVDPMGLRDVVVAIWDSRITPSSISVGQVFVGETDGRVITSQFPNPPATHSDNITYSYNDTVNVEGRKPNAVYKVHVPNDSAFNTSAALEREMHYWDFDPTEISETNCTAAAYRSLNKGGVNVNGGFNWTPDSLNADLKNLAGRARSGVTTLRHVPWDDR